MAAVLNNNELSLSDIGNVLHENGLGPAVFPFLRPDAHRYSCLLIQPEAEISDTPTGVLNRDTELARAKHRAFHALAVANAADLMVSPEYSCPWDVVEESIATGRVPASGKLWIVGCEGISRADLEQRRGRAPAAAKWICEDLNSIDWSGGKAFLDAVCLIFRARSLDTGQDAVVVLIQFKSFPMGGVVYEANLLARGRTYYLIRNSEADSIKLVCLLCSDVLSFHNPEWGRLRELFASLASLLVVHIQLNASPRDAQYRAYRTDVLGRQEYRELICLNWARNVTVHSQGHAVHHWTNDSVSAIYSRRWDEKPLDEQRLEASETRGLHFCYAHELRSMVAFLNFREQCYGLLLTKPNQNLSHVQNRIPQPPEVTNVWTWSADTSAWTGATLPIDGEARGPMTAAGINVDEITPIVTVPLRFERFCAISIGNMPLRASVRDTEWPEFKSVYAHNLDPAESILRISYAQDSCQASVQARTNSYMRLAMFLAAARNPENFPEWMVGFRNHTLTYESNAPYSNLRSELGKPGTAVYLPTGDLPKASAVRTRIEKHIRSMSETPVECDPLYVVTWVPQMGPGGVSPRVYPEAPTPKHDDDPNVGENDIDGAAS